MSYQTVCLYFFIFCFISCSFNAAILFFGGTPMLKSFRARMYRKLKKEFESEPLEIKVMPRSIWPATAQYIVDGNEVTKEVFDSMREKN